MSAAMRAASSATLQAHSVRGQRALQGPFRTACQGAGHRSQGVAAKAPDIITPTRVRQRRPQQVHRRGPHQGAAPPARQAAIAEPDGAWDTVFICCRLTRDGFRYAR